MFVLIGGQMLYALRRVDNSSDGRKTFQCLGEAYFHGLMDGEALELLKDGKVEVESIVIR